MKAPFRVGLGYDIHRFAPGRRLILGGVEIPSPEGLLGHSDADVLIHALADAILGAVGEQDIGHLFPNHDPKLEGLDSRRILERAVALADAAGYRIGNCDVVVVAEKPKVGPHRDAMKAVLAPLLGVEKSAVGIKATTHEGLGALGRAEGIAVQAVVLLLAKTP